MGLTGNPPHAAPASSHQPSRPAATNAFSYLPQRCALLSAPVVAEYLSGTTCASNAYENPGGAESRAVWDSTRISASGDYFGGDVDVMLSPSSIIGSVFDQMKSLDTVTSRFQKIRDSRPVAGLGDAAYIVFKTSTGSSQTYLVVDDKNAQINISYGAAVHGQAPSRAWAEGAVLAMARDIIKKLR
jgi:hypothetical protein